MIDIIVPVYKDPRIFRLISSIYNSKNNNLCRLLIIEASEDYNFNKELRNNIREIDILISEPDNGIFDGFNKGLVNSTSPFICMLGADDYFDGNFDFGKVVEIGRKYDVIIPKYVYFKGDRIKRLINYKSYKWFQYYFGKPFYHTGTFLKSEIAKSEFFDVSEELKYCADFKYFFEILKKKKPSIKSFDGQVKIESGGASGSWKARIYNFKAMIKIYPKRFYPLIPLIFSIRYSYKLIQLKWI